MKNFFSEFGQICKKLRLVKFTEQSLTENFIFWAVHTLNSFIRVQHVSPWAEY